ncbi:MAG TPA: MBL fold metallo-hydrolase [Polyangia bacterium]|jgi:phosphoribosyl 1,2-cyclic phosphodiesterase
MEVTFWGVRGSIPAPGPGTVRYGGNTSCVSVRTSTGALLVLDCGTGARNLGLALLAEDSADKFATGGSEAAILLSHAHWDHIQGFPFFGPLYVAGNRFRIYGPAESSALLEGILEGQMAPQYFPVQTLKNMGARIEIVAMASGEPRDILGCRITAAINPHGRAGAMAFRIEEGGRSVVYASDAGYGASGPTDEVRALYRGADLLIHDSTFTPEDRARYPQRGLASVTEAVSAAITAGARKLALFHYDQDYTDSDVDLLVDRARRALEDASSTTELHAAVEGATLTV